MTEDDTYIGCYFRSKGIPLYVIGTFYPDNMRSSVFLDQLNFRFMDSSKIQNLYAVSNTGNMEKSRAIVAKYFCM